jgi:hypothetical protein
MPDKRPDTGAQLVGKLVVGETEEEEEVSVAVGDTLVEWAVVAVVVDRPTGRPPLF